MGRVEREADKWFLVGMATCLRTSEKAIMVKLSDGLENYWIPKSQLHPEENEVREYGDQGMLVCASWVAKEKGWLKG